MDKKDIPPNIRAFLENMLYASDEFGFGEEIPEGLLRDLNGKLDDRISSYLLSKLSSEKLSEYRVLKERGESAEGLDVFLMRNIPDYKESMKQAYKDFYDSYLEQVRDARFKVDN